MWYIYTMEYYSAIKKNSFESVLMRWMKLEPVSQSEVSQKDKDNMETFTVLNNDFQSVIATYKLLVILIFFSINLKKRVTIFK